MKKRAHQAASDLDASISCRGAVFEAVPGHTDHGCKGGALHGLGHDVYAIGHALAGRYLEDGFGQPHLIANGRGTTGQDYAPHEMLGESTGIDELMHFLQELTGALEDNHFEYFPVYDFGGTVDGGLQFNLCCTARGAINFILIGLIDFPLNERFGDTIFEDEFIGFFKGNMEACGNITGNVEATPIETLGGEDSSIAIHGQAGGASAHIENRDAQLHVFRGETAESCSEGEKDHVFQLAPLGFDTGNDIVFNDRRDLGEMDPGLQDTAANADGVTDAEVIDIPLL